MKRNLIGVWIMLRWSKFSFGLKSAQNGSEHYSAYYQPNLA